MADEPNGAPAPDAGTITPIAIETTGPLSVSSAAEALRKARDAQDKPAAETKDTSAPTNRAPDGKFAKVETESAPATEQDASPEAVPGDDQQADPAELPSVEPPRSWSKEDKELFNSLPRETQERLAERERSRESDFLQRQNETAEKTKALTAKEQQAEQARQQYEQATANAFQVIQSELARDFPDIKSQEDAAKLASEDPFRWAQWKQRIDNLQTLHSEVQRQQQLRAQETQDKFKTWATEQDEAFTKQFPEFADDEKAKTARSTVTNYLTKAVGVKPESLPALWESELFRDARFQRVIYDAARFNAAKEKATAVAAAPKPAPQRPGVTQGKGDAQRATIESLAQRLPNAKGIESVRVAAELYRTQKRASQ